MTPSTLLPFLLSLALSGILPFESPEGRLGYAFSTNAGTIMTTSHLVEGRAGRVKALGEYAYFSLFWRGPATDLAVLVPLEGPLLVPILEVNPTPAIGEAVYYKCGLMLPGQEKIDLISSGQLSALDANHVYVEGFVAAGCSGSAILTGDGRVIGMVQSALIWGNDLDGLLSTTPLLVGTRFTKQPIGNRELK